MSRAFFDQVADHLVGFLPPALRDFSWYRTGHNLKLWYGESNREHFEVQLISAAAMRAGGRRSSGPSLEVGFHAEHPTANRNEEAVALLLSKERTWRKALGRGAEPGPFLGRQKGTWRRLSEVWEGDGLISPETAVEAAERLARYVGSLRPLLD